MRKTYANRKFVCECGDEFREMVQIFPEKQLVKQCKCGKRALQIEEVDAVMFKPFWSDTLQMRIMDRQDLQKLRAYAKKEGLINVGHEHQKPDRWAIRYNYEHD